MTAILEAQKQRVARQGIDIEKLKHHMAVATAKLECRKEGTRFISRHGQEKISFWTLNFSTGQLN